MREFIIEDLSSDVCTEETLINVISNFFSIMNRYVTPKQAIEIYCVINVVFFEFHFSLDVVVGVFFSRNEKSPMKNKQLAEKKVFF